MSGSSTSHRAGNSHRPGTVEFGKELRKVFAVQFIYSDLGQRQRGDVVEVVLQGSEVNIALLDSPNYSAFKNGRRWRGVGGLAKRSPILLSVPRASHWYGVAYIPGGYRGRVRAGFRVLPGALPPIRRGSPSPLGSIRQAADDYLDSFADADHPDRAFDVFISHAGEDKDAVVRPLALALRERGLEVWYDEFELRIGDSLRRKIDRGLVACRFGVVVLSPSFFAKGWPNYKLDGLVTREVAGERQLILPIWHQVTKADVMGYSPSLADKLARSTADVSIDAMADEITDVVRPCDREDVA